MRKLFILLILFFAGYANAATYYVEAKASSALNLVDETSGACDTEWAAATSIGSPTSLGTAMYCADDDDVVYFRGGTYNFAFSSYVSDWVGMFSPANSGSIGSPITFIAYTGETPIWNVTGQDATDQANLFSTAGQEYITLDGFTVMGGSGTRVVTICVSGNTGVEDPYKKGNIVQNMTLDGGAVFAGSNNRDGIWVSDSDGALIKNNTIYDYAPGNGDDNYAGIKMYHVENSIFENNYIYNCERGIYSKSNMNSSIIRYNFITDVSVGIYDASFISQTYSSNNNSVYHNIVLNASFVGIRWRTEDGLTVAGNVFYNNTLYNTDIGIRIQNGTGWEIYNNVIRRETGSSRYHIALGETFELDVSNYNLFDSTQTNPSGFNITTRYDVGGGNVYTSLASWQSSGEETGSNNPGANSVYDDPEYVNTSGNMNEIADFALAVTSPGYQTGVGGIDMGADVSLVGVDAGEPEPEVPANAIQGMQISNLNVTDNLTAWNRTDNLR